MARDRNFLAELRVLRVSMGLLGRRARRHHDARKRERRRGHCDDARPTVHPSSSDHVQRTDPTGVRAVRLLRRRRHVTRARRPDHEHRASTSGLVHRDQPVILDQRRLDYRGKGAIASDLPLADGALGLVQTCRK